MMVLTIAMLAVSMNLSAQDKQSNEQRMSREELAEKQARQIAHELALDETTAQRYVSTYMDYMKDLWALGPRIGSHQQEEVSETKTAMNIKKRFDRDKKIIELREKYYGYYSQFLTQKQIERAYELERQSMRRLTHRHHQKAGGKGMSHRTHHRR